MGFKDAVGRVRNTFNFRKKSAGGNPWADNVFFHSLREVMAAMGGGATKPFTQSTWVYASVSKIAENISNTPLKLYKSTEDADNGKEEIPESAVLELLNEPNPYMTGQQLLEATEVYKGLRGEAIWILENRENVTQLPDRIWCFDPARFEPIKDKNTGMIVSWKYNGIKAIYFPVHQILHFKTFNPYDDIRGLAPLEAARAAIDQDYFANKFNLQFFKGGAAVAGFVEVEDKMTDNVYNRFLSHLNQKTEGIDQAHTIGILEGGAKFKETKLSQKDMEYIKGKKVTREEIFAVYGTNSVVLGLYQDIKSYEGIKTAHKVFWQETLIPKMGYFETVINEKFVKPVTGKQNWLEFDLAGVSSLQEDYGDKLDSGKKLMELGYPANMINRRLELGMEELPWGDSWFHPMNLVSDTSGEINEGDDNALPADKDTGKEYIPMGGGGRNKLTFADVKRIDKYLGKSLSNKKGTYKETTWQDEITIEPQKVLSFTREDLAKSFYNIEELVKKDADEALVCSADVGCLTGDGKKRAAEKEVLDEPEDALDVEDEKIWNDYIDMQRPIEKKFLKAIRGYFFKQRKGVLKELFYYYGNKSVEEMQELLTEEIKIANPTKGAKAFITKDLTDDIFDSGEESKKLEKTLMPLYEVAVKDSVNYLAGWVGDVGFEFDPLDEDYLGIMELRVKKIPPMMVGTVKGQLRDTLVAGVGSGETVAELAERVRGVYRDASSRALTIARTESGSAISSGRFAYMKKKGYKQHRWITAMDGKERATHDAMRNSITNVGQVFRYVNADGSYGGKTQLKYPGDMSAPADEVINCRCVTVPYFEGE